MDLGNSFEVVVHYILIGGMFGFGYRDEVPIVSALVCMVTHCIRPMVIHDRRLLGSHC